MGTCPSNCLNSNQAADTQRVKKNDIESGLKKNKLLSEAKGADAFASDAKDGSVFKYANTGKREKRPAVTLPNQAVYTGEWLDGKRDGFGV